MAAWQIATYLHVSRQRGEAIWRNVAYRFPQPVAKSPHRWDGAEVESSANAHWWGTRELARRRGVL